MVMHTSDKEFFLDGKMYKTLRVDRTHDELLAWEFDTRRRVVLSYSYVQHNREKTYNIHEVSEMLNRSKKYIWNLWYNGEIPARTYHSIATNRPYGLRWSPSDIMEAWEFFASKHYGRPRKDGAVIPYKLPSKRELRAMLNQETILYYKDSKTGEFKPTWKA